MTDIITMPTSQIGAPNYVPARMLNEVVYCPRLAFLEWVQSEFSDNAYTVHGRAIHRRVDRERGILPAPEDEPPAINDAADANGADPRTDASCVTVDSLTLSSDRLGIIARIDRLERMADGECIPIDTKRSGIPDTEARAYDPERVQLCAQGLILRDNGYHCDRGMIYFAAANRRIEVRFDDELIARTIAAIGAARDLHALRQPPEPLVDSPKCLGCSLAPICLPDEVNLLCGRSRETVRPFAAPSMDAKPVYVSESGAKVGKSGETLTITRRGESKAALTLRLIDISALHLLTTTQISSQALTTCIAHEIPVLWHTSGGWFSGIAHGHGHKNIDLRVAQFKFADNPAQSLALAREFVVGKIRNQRTMLRRNTESMPAHALTELNRQIRAATQCDDMSSLLGIEGIAARVYFSHFTDMLRPATSTTMAFDFTNRQRRPPPDPVNALLSFAYSLLVRDCTLAVLQTGFDPYLGFYHQPRYGRPSLALDLMEEFRPLIADSVVIGLINRAEIAPRDFVSNGPSCNLTAAGRRTVTAAYERRMAEEIHHPRFGYRAVYRRILAMQARLLARCLLGELDAYPAFTTR